MQTQTQVHLETGTYSDTQKIGTERDGYIEGVQRFFRLIVVLVKAGDGKEGIGRKRNPE
jgi:hypothetical protein